MTVDQGPSLLAAMAASVDLWKQHQRARAAPKDEPPEAIPGVAKRRASLARVTNPARGSTPPLTIWKRVPEQEASMPSSVTDLIKQADWYIRNGDLDSADRVLDRANRAIRALDKHSVHVHMGNDDDDDNSTVEDTWSEAADSNADGNNASLDADDDDDNSSRRKVSKWAHDQVIRKWSDDYSLPGFGGTASPAQPESTVMGPRHGNQTYNTGITPIGGQPPLRTKFDSRIDYIQDRDKCSRSDAQRKARVEFPADYTNYQQLLSEQPTDEQHTRRYPVGSSTKRAPVTYEDLVSTEMAKGVNMEVAGQRVMQQYGGTALNHRMIQKRGPSVARRFAKAATEIMYEDGVDRCEALRRLRKERPDWYDALNSS
jgi:hypothetical protein